MPVLLRIAFRNLLEHKAKSLIIGIIIALGVTILVVGNAFIDTAALGIKRTFLDNFTGNVIINGKTDAPVSLFGVSSPGGMEATPTIPGYDKVMGWLKEQREVKSVTSQLTGMATISVSSDVNSEDAVPTMLFGIDPATYRPMFDNLSFVSGGYLTPGEEGILLSRQRVKEIEKDLKVKVAVGDTLLLNGFGGTGLHIRRVTVRGIYNFKQKNDALEFISYADVQTVRGLLGLTLGSTKVADLSKSDTSLLGANDADSLFGGGDMVSVDNGAAKPVAGKALTSILGDTGGNKRAEQLDTGAWHFILVDLTDSNDAPRFIAKTNAWLQEQHLSAEAGDWKKASGGLGSISDVVRAIFIAAILIVAIVAVIIIMNTLIVSVIERTSEIGTMRALGAQKSFVWRMFMSETLVISIVFGLAGMILGSAVIGVLNVMGIHATNSFLQILFGGEVLRPAVSLASLATALGVVVLIGVLAHLYPVAVALKVEPVRAIQTE